MWRKAICPYDCPATCGLLIKEEKGKILEVKGDPRHPVSKGVICEKMKRYADSMYGPGRILYPMKRTGKKGEGKFQRITWEEAVSEITGKWKNIIKEWGSEAILPAVYSGVMSDIQRNCGHAFFNRMGASEIVMTLCSSAKGEGYRQVMGNTPSLEPDELKDSDFCILWGCHGKATRIHSLIDLINRRKKGARLVMIEAYANATAAYMDQVILVRPGTDGMLALSMMHVLVREKLTDEIFLREKTEGYETFEKSLAEYTPQRAEEITGVKAEVIENLAVAYGKAHAPSILLGSGNSRYRNGAMTVRIITLLPALVGAWKKPGGGLCGCRVTRKALVDLDRIRRPDFRDKPGRKININQLAGALTDQKKPVKSLYVYGLNPADTVSDQKVLLEGLAREDLFTVVHERFMTDTARYCDILLPAVFSPEQTDIYRSYGYPSVGYGKKIVEPAGECKSNWNTFQILALAMGYREPYFRMSEEEIAFHILHHPTEYLNQISAEEYTYLMEGGAVKMPGEDHLKIETKNGKILFVNQEAEEKIPRYIQLEEDEYPLHLVAVPSEYTLNTEFTDRKDMTDRRGKMTLKIHPVDAGKRGIRNGQRILCFNRLAEVEFIAELEEKMLPQTVAVQGVYGISESLNGYTVNALCHQRLSDWGEATTLNDNRVDIRPL
ncbi:MAG: molybdopterin-dependent oxidoreductase [Ruminococcus sp.]|jgi:anaerobic selenocysteine-containing dehydrogenase